MGRQQCHDVPEQKCETVYKEECDTTPRTQCSERTERQCAASPSRSALMSLISSVTRCPRLTARYFPDKLVPRFPPRTVRTSRGACVLWYPGLLPGRSLRESVPLTTDKSVRTSPSRCVVMSTLLAKCVTRFLMRSVRTSSPPSPS